MPRSRNRLWRREQPDPHGLCARREPLHPRRPGGRAHPGRHVRQMLREMMLYHTRNIPDLADSVRQSLWFLEFLRDKRAVSAPWRALLDHEVQALVENGEGSLCHDDLAEFNDPVYFRDF